MLEEIGQVLLFLVAIGMVGLVLYRLFLVATGLVIIGLVAFGLFVEVYGLYLLLTDTALFLKDIQDNGVFSFTTAFIGVNLALLFYLVKRTSYYFNKRLP